VARNIESYSGNKANSLAIYAAACAVQVHRDFKQYQFSGHPCIIPKAHAHSLKRTAKHSELEDLRAKVARIGEDVKDISDVQKEQRRDHNNLKAQITRQCGTGGGGGGGDAGGGAGAVYLDDAKKRRARKRAAAADKKKAEDAAS
jgi:hypothetical protein